MMQNLGWGTVDQRVVEQAHRRLIAAPRQPAFLIKQAMSLNASPSPAEVAALLNKASIDFVIIGAHALAVHTGEPRATRDVDVVVDDVAAAVRVLKAIRPRTQILDLGLDVGKRIADARGGKLIDVLSHTGGVRGELFTHRMKVTLDGNKASIPTVTAMLARQAIGF